MARLDKKVGELAYDDIIADTEPTALVTTVKLAASEGPLERGTVLVAASADAECSPASTALTATDCLFVLAEDIEKAEGSDVAQAYKTGNFYRDRLKTDGEYELAAADIETLRKSGIQTKSVIEALDAEGV